MNQQDRNAQLRVLPKVDRVLGNPRLVERGDHAPRTLLVEAVRLVMERVRHGILAGPLDSVPDEDQIVSQVLNQIDLWLSLGKRPVINATGTLLHTNLGRARIPDEVARHGYLVARSCVDLELDIHSGTRGGRYANLKELCKLVTGAPDTVAVNNNAAAVLLLVNALARGREVVVSRGELIEIGGSFRLPDIIVAAGARLVEVGTTNRTHVEDYRRAITEDTALFLKSHTSNYKIIGFSDSVSTSDLCALGREVGVTVYEDLGSGNLVDLTRYGLEKEPTVTQVLEQGIDLVSFSTDKLLGGPQGGLIAGREDLIGTIRSHPLMRALRMGKVGLSMIEKTLGLYLDPARIDERIPLYQALSRPIDTLEAQARDIRDRILDASAEQTTEAEPGTEAERGTGMGGFQIRIEPDVSQIGAGSCPTVTRESRALVLKHESLTARQVAQSLRDGDPPVIARVHGESVRLDMRTVFPEDVESVVCALQRLIRSGNDGATSTRWSS